LVSPPSGLGLTVGAGLDVGAVVGDGLGLRVGPGLLDGVTVGRTVVGAMVLGVGDGAGLAS
jgi:hypothetical protein